MNWGLLNCDWERELGWSRAWGLVFEGQTMGALLCLVDLQFQPFSVLRTVSRFLSAALICGDVLTKNGLRKRKRWLGL